MSAPGTRYARNTPWTLRFTGHVSDLRLLAEPEARHVRMIDIALAAGFSDASHSNRLFRKRYGVTPSAVPEQVRRASRAPQVVAGLVPLARPIRR